MALSEIAMQHAENAYSRCRNFGGLPVRNMVLINLPDATMLLNQTRNS